MSGRISGRWMLLCTAAVGLLAMGVPAGAANGTAPPRPKTLFNSGDPTLALTPPLRGSPAAPPGSAPPNPNPRDLEGVWWLHGYEYLLGPAPGVPPPLKPKYMKLLELRIRAKNRGTPEADGETQCLSHGMPRLMESPYPIEIVQTPGRITFLHEVAHEVRRIYLNRAHPKHLRLTWLGDSVGHWDGDTLVVDTIGIDARSFIDDEGSSHSSKEHLIERYRKIDGGTNLELIMTVEDPVTLEHPYSYRRIYHWRPDVRPEEYICEENNRNFPVNGVTVAK
ncbi:MAG TPA: hypothetical protein VMU67_02580 [Steroidobacteraceae bacterium]|nr:hypothetical protein [Steroidobacteraceae bacterium]